MENSVDAVVASPEVVVASPVVAVPEVVVASPVVAVPEVVVASPVVAVPEVVVPVVAVPEVVVASPEVVAVPVVAVPEVVVPVVAVPEVVVASPEVVAVPVVAVPEVVAVPVVPPIIASPVIIAMPDINLTPIFNSIVKDYTFITNMKAAVGRIMKDGAVNEYDIPDIIVVILETVNLMKSVRVTADQLSALVKMLFHYIMDSYSLIVADKKAAFDKLLDYSVRLFLLKPTVSEVTNAVTNVVTNVVNEVQEVHQAARRLFPCCS